MITLVTTSRLSIQIRTKRSIAHPSNPPFFFHAEFGQHQCEESVITANELNTYALSEPFRPLFIVFTLPDYVFQHICSSSLEDCLWAT